MPLMVTATRSAQAAPATASIKAAFTAKKHAVRGGVAWARPGILIGPILVDKCRNRNGWRWIGKPSSKGRFTATLVPLSLKAARLSRRIAPLVYSAGNP